MENEQADAGRDGRTRLTRPNSQARTGTGKNDFSPVQLTTSNIGNQTRLIPMAYSAQSANHTYIPPRVRRHRVSSPQDSSRNGSCLYISRTHLWYVLIVDMCDIESIGGTHGSTPHYYRSTTEVLPKYYRRVTQKISEVLIHHTATEVL